MKFLVENEMLDRPAAATIDKIKRETKTSTKVKPFT